MVKLIAEEAGVPESAVFVDVPRNSQEQTMVYFWTAKMSKKELERLTGAKAANFRGSHGGGVSRRYKVAAFLSDFNAEGWLTKANPREAKPEQLHRLKGPKIWCVECGEKLLTPQEEFVGKCEGCSPK